MTEEVGGAVDGVTEALDPLARCHRGAHPRGGVVGIPIASSVSRARLGAPPCSGPESEPSAATTAATEVGAGGGHRRATKVDALKPWSMPRMRYCSMARARTGSGSVRRRSCTGSSPRR